jgi:hypothetical protein
VSPRTLTIPVLVVLALCSVSVRAFADGPPPTPGSSTPPVPPTPPPPVPGPTVTRGTVALVAAGVAVVGTGAATVFGVLTLQNKSDYASHPTYANTDSGNNDAAYADGCMALAVAAGVTSLVLYLTRDTSHDADPAAAQPAPRSAGLSPSPMVTPHGGGAGFVLRF